MKGEERKVRAVMAGTFEVKGTSNFKDQVWLLPVYSNEYFLEKRIFERFIAYEKLC